MCDIRHTKERIQTWLMLTRMDNVDQSAAIKRLRQLDRRFNRLVDDYSKVLVALQEDYKNAKDVQVDSNTGPT